MTTTIGSLDLNAFSDLYNDSNQYFWFESNSSAIYGAGVHVTLVPDTTFISNPTGQNILMNTDGFSIRNGLLPMMTLDNDSLDFNVVDTTAGTYTTTATFTSTGAQIGQSGGAHSVIDANGQRFYAIDGTTQLANIGYGEGQSQTGTNVAPYYTFGTRLSTNDVYDSSSTYNIGDHVLYDEREYVCVIPISTPQSWSTSRWRLAIGNYSVAEGDSVTSGAKAHAEGMLTSAIGAMSHAEGLRTIASGFYAHAQGCGTKAIRRSDTVIGEYNIPHDTAGIATESTRGSYAFIIGNGTSDTVRSNALTVGWSGDVCLALDTTVASGTTDGDLYAAIRALSWESYVIV